MNTTAAVPIDARRTVDPELATRARRGDRSSVEALFRAHHEVAWRMACATTGFTPDAEIALLEGFGRAFDTLPAELDRDFVFRPHLLACVRRVAVDLAHRRAMNGTDGPAALPAVEHGEDGLDAVGPQLFREALRRLPEHRRTIVWLTTVEAAEPEEVGFVMGVEPGYVSEIASLAWTQIAAHCLERLQRRGKVGCWPTIDCLGGYLSGELVGVGRLAVADHLRGCLSCTRLQRQLADPAASLGSAAVPVPALTAEAVQSGSEERAVLTAKVSGSSSTTARTCRRMAEVSGVFGR